MTSPHAILGIGLLLGAASLSLSGCGAASELDEDVEPRAMSDACVQRGGDWTELNCVGAQDFCGLNVCSQAFGVGCDCPRPGECWDADEWTCRPERESDAPDN